MDLDTGSRLCTLPAITLFNVFIIDWAGSVVDKDLGQSESDDTSDLQQNCRCGSSVSWNLPHLLRHKPTGLVLGIYAGHVRRQVATSPRRFLRREAALCWI